VRHDRNQSPASGQRSDSSLFYQGLFQPDPQLQQLHLEANQEPHQNIQVLQTIFQSKNVEPTVFWKHVCSILTNIKLYFNLLQLLQNPIKNKTHLKCFEMSYYIFNIVFTQRFINLQNSLIVCWHLWRLSLAGSAPMAPNKLISTLKNLQVMFANVTRYFC
jgi:hypothetical protein